jgi:DNA invertase Pin-like site-specific DNA recombinase
MENNNTSKTRAKITIAKYKRVSTFNQDVEMSLQEESINLFIKRMKEDNPNNEYLIKNYEDYGVSGKTTERKAFMKMMSDVEKGFINIIIFTKLDRLARSLQDLLNTTSILDSKGVKFIVVEQNLDTTTYQGRLLFQIIGAFSEFERNIIRERMEAGRKRAEIVGTKSGKPCHRPQVKIDEDGVRYKFKKGMSMHSIAKQYKVSITPIRRILSQEIEEKQVKEYEKLKEKYEK